MISWDTNIDVFFCSQPKILLDIFKHPILSLYIKCVSHYMNEWLSDLLAYDSVIAKMYLISLISFWHFCVQMGQQLLTQRNK